MSIFAFLIGFWSWIISKFTDFVLMPISKSKHLLYWGPEIHRIYNLWISLASNFRPSFSRFTDLFGPCQGGRFQWKIFPGSEINSTRPNPKIQLPSNMANLCLLFTKMMKKGKQRTKNSRRSFKRMAWLFNLSTCALNTKFAVCDPQWSASWWPSQANKASVNFSCSSWHEMQIFAAGTDAVESYMCNDLCQCKKIYTNIIHLK